MVQSSDSSAFEQALKDELSKADAYKTKEDGTLEFDDYLSLKLSVLKHASLSVAQKREEIKTKRVDAFKAQNQQEYVKIFRADTGVVMTALDSFAVLACEHVGVAKEVWQKSNATYLADKVKVPQIKLAEIEVRKGLVKKEVTEDAETIMKALKLKIVKDIKLQEKMAHFRGTLAPAAIGEVHAIEQTKVSDSIFLEFGFDLDHLMNAAKHHKIAPDNPQLKSFAERVMNEAREANAKREFDQTKPSAEIVAEMLEEAKQLGEPAYNQDGTVSWEFFLESCKLVSKYNAKQTMQRIETSVTMRRSALKKENARGVYGKLVGDLQKWKKGCKAQLQFSLYSHLKVPKTVFIKSV